MDEDFECEVPNQIPINQPLPVKNDGYSFN